MMRGPARLLNPLRLVEDVWDEIGILADRAKGTVTDVRKLMHTMGLEAAEAHVGGDSNASNTGSTETAQHSEAVVATSTGGDSRGRQDRAGAPRAGVGTHRGGNE